MQGQECTDINLKKKCLYSQTLACFVPIKDVQLAVSVSIHYLLIFSTRSTSIDYASKDLLNPKMKFIQTDQANIATKFPNPKD